MASEAAAGSLSSTFNKLNHWRHNLMDFTMIVGAIGLVVASGGSMGLLDPIGIFAQMHFPSMESLAAIPDFLTGAFQSVADGTLLTSTASVAADPHAMHAVAETAAHTVHAAAEAFTSEWDWFASLADPVRDQMITDAATFGMPLQDYIADWCAQQNILSAAAPGL